MSVHSFEALACLQLLLLQTEFRCAVHDPNSMAICDTCLAVMCVECTTAAAHRCYADD